MSTSGGTRAILAALFANLGIAVAKFVAFVITGSSSMLAESIHSVADSSNQGLLLLGGKQAKRRPDEEHPFGYGRSRYFYAFVVAVVLFTLGSLFAFYEGWHKLQHTREHPGEGVEKPAIAIGVLVVAIMLETYSFRTAIVESNRVRGSQSWVQFVRHSKSPELPVILLEDLGAEVGLILALIGVVLAAVTGNGLYDALGTMSIGVLLGVIAIILAIETKSLLLGEGASKPDVAKIKNAITDDRDVSRLIHLKTLYLGPEELLVAAKVQLGGHLSFADVSAAINRAEQRVRTAVPHARVMYLEPDSYDPNYVDPVPPDEAAAAH
jgi:cation diffusion facilitator family transporter